MKTASTCKGTDAGNGDGDVGLGGVVRGPVTHGSEAQSRCCWDMNKKG